MDVGKKEDCSMTSVSWLLHWWSSVCMSNPYTKKRLMRKSACGSIDKLMVWYGNELAH